MANTFSAEANKYLNSVPVQLADGAAHGGNLRRYRATIALASQASADTITLAKPPAGGAFAYGVLTSTVSLGTSTVAIGVAGTPGKFRAAAVFTAVDTPTLFGIASAVDDAPLSAAETVILTIGVAALPAAGTLIVDLYYSAT